MESRRAIKFIDKIIKIDFFYNDVIFFYRKKMREKKRQNKYNENLVFSLLMKSIQNH